MKKYKIDYLLHCFFDEVYNASELHKIMTENQITQLEILERFAAIWGNMPAHMKKLKDQHARLSAYDLLHALIDDLLAIGIRHELNENYKKLLLSPVYRYYIRTTLTGFNKLKLHYPTFRLESK